MKFIIPTLIVLIVCLFSSCGPNLPVKIKDAYGSLPKALDFNIDVKPILSDKCFACHGPDKGKIKAGLQLHESTMAFAELLESPGKFPIVPGNLAASEVFHRIISEDQNTIMPPPESNLKLSDYEKAVLIKWIKEGAKYEPHWAFVKPKPVLLPEVKQKDWPQNEIDHFVLTKLEQNGLKPSETAEKTILLRRLSLDLTGLPPTPEEIQSFLLDESPQAYEKQVDRLLNSNHFGEKMAMDWMDIARFADTHGYTVDRYRDMSPWRDWVIQAFNENKPYDEFITWQLAGDLLPNPSKEQLLATGFNRLHQQNMEGGIIDEEFRVEYVADRTAVLGTGLMAMTLACARCHDHKYDPISQKEHYELYSFFNSVNESGQISWNNDTPVPTMLLPTKEQEQILAFLEKQVHLEEQKLSELQASEQSHCDQWLQAQKYQSINAGTLDIGFIAKYPLNGHLKDQSGKRKGKMNRTASAKELPTFVPGKSTQGLLMDGDAWLDLHPVGSFKRSDRFSIGLWINIPDTLTEGVILHRCDGAKLYNFKGYQIYLRENHIEIMLAHTAPDNAIVKLSKSEIPKNEWIHLMMVYDGSSKADGLTLYLNGKRRETSTEHDNLYKDIHYGRTVSKEPGLQIGARWRGKGIKGAVVDDILVFERVLSPLEVMWLVNPNQAKALIAKPYQSLQAEERKILADHYFTTLSKPLKTGDKALAAVQRTYVDSIEPVKEVMIMKDMVKPRPTFILERGQYDVYGEEVFPNTPEKILPFPKEYPKNRLGLANWLFHPDHPLTARVAVNRYWQHYFGRGIVATSEDFGNQGGLPSHPKLLDWLALYFMESGWDVKALQKIIVMSATYRQQSTPNNQLRELDPDNILLAYGPSFRMSSEIIRDNALFASGLLSKRIGGESVKPYQPEGLWAMTGDTYKRDEGEKLYRRSLYTFWKRTAPHPTQATFDQPDRSECSVRRQKTNTPLQALVLLNDPTFLEASKKLGEEISRANNSPEAIQSVFLKLTGRKPIEQELNILIDLQQKEYTKMIMDKSRISGWLKSGEYQSDSLLDPNWLAANAVVASAILNSDGAITRR